MSRLSFSADGKFEILSASRDLFEETDLFEFEAGTLACAILSIDISKALEIISQLTRDDCSNEDTCYKEPNNWDEVYIKLTEYNIGFRVLTGSYRTILDKIKGFAEQTRPFVDFWKKCELDARYRDFDFVNFLCETQYFFLSKAIDGYETYPNSASVVIGKSLEQVFEEYSKNRANTVLMRNYMVNNFEGALAASALELVRQGKTIKFCKNCGRAFVPEHRSDTSYCSSPSPQNSSLSCQEYATRRLWYDRMKEDGLAVLSKNIYSAKNMLAKRNPDIPAYREMFERFKKERLEWKKAYRDGSKTAEEYLAWLNEMKEKKR